MVDRIHSKRRRIMRSFTINEISGVDRPAQKHARMTLMKRDDADDGFDKADEDLYTKEEANYRGADGPSRCEACEYFNGEAGCSMVAGEISAGDVCDHFEQGDDPMTDVEKKQLADLQKSADDLTKQLEAATAKAADLQKESDDAKAKLEDEEKKRKAAEAEKADATTKAEMTDAEKAYLATLEGAEKMKFMTATPEERAKMMAKRDDDNPVIYKAADGVEFHKSDDPRLIAMAKRADEGEKLAKVEAKKREDTELSKRADDELKNFSETVAKRDDKIEALRAIDKIEPGAKAALLKMLEVGGKAISASFERVGHGREALHKSAQDFEKRVSAIQERDKCARPTAMSKARAEDPDAYAAYQAAGSN